MQHGNLNQTTCATAVSTTDTQMKASLSTESCWLQPFNSQSIQSHASNSFLPKYASSSESGNDLISKLLLSRPEILGATRNETAVIIKWTFPLEIHTFVSKYTIIYSDRVNNTSRFQAWVDIGSVDALLLPMAVTLYNVSGGNCGMFALKALFHNGLHSQISKPVVI